MTHESKRINVRGNLLHRLVMHPGQGVRERAILMFYHGQGDYAERYLDILTPFTQRGIRCVITELPGHGYSPGRRGHCGDVELLDRIVDDALLTLNGLPYGVAGHSMGGLLAARHLVLAGQGVLPEPAFAWLSSPLIRPSYGRSSIFVKMIRWFAPLIPALTISTGVTPAMCRIESESDEASNTEPTPPKHQLWHSRISLGWGAALLDIEKQVHDHLSEIPAGIPLLYTQGAEDPICPSRLAREFFTRLPNTDKQYVEMEGLLHEPFRGEGSEKLFAALDAWLDHLPL